MPVQENSIMNRVPPCHTNVDILNPKGLAQAAQDETERHLFSFQKTQKWKSKRLY